MFGKPRWFRPKAIGWGVVPITWQGWGYSAGWTAAILSPFMLLVSREQPLEALAWLGIGIGALAWDVRQIRSGMGLPPSRRATPAPAAVPSAAKHDDNVLYIMDSSPGAAVATRNYRMQVRR